VNYVYNNTHTHTHTHTRRNGLPKFGVDLSSDEEEEDEDGGPNRAHLRGRIMMSDGLVKVRGQEAGAGGGGGGGGGGAPGWVRGSVGLRPPRESVAFDPDLDMEEDEEDNPEERNDYNDGGDAMDDA